MANYKRYLVTLYFQANEIKALTHIMIENALSAKLAYQLAVKQLRKSISFVRVYKYRAVQKNKL
jgi:hypothetical protein